MSLSDMLDAIRRDNLEELRTIVSMQKCTQDLRNTLLYEAVKENKKVITEFLLQVGSNPNSGNHSSVTPLHLAAKRGNLEIIEILLNHGADINAKDYFWTSPLVYAIKKEKDDAAQLLLERGSYLFSDKEGRSPLHVSVTRGSLKISKILLQNGAPLNAVITSGLETGYTPLHCAIESKNEGAALLLINRGAKLDNKFIYRKTILRLALARRLLSTVEEILTRCPDPQGEIAKCKQIFESLPQEMINILLKYCFDIEFLHIAIRKGYIQIIESILKDKLDLTANFDVIRSSVLIAVKSKQVKSAEVLVAHGADINARDETGMTPLMEAVEDNNLEMTTLLIFHGADVKIADDAFGKTVLHIAASQYCTINPGLHYALEIAKRLLAAGADVNAATTIEKLTPLHVACKRSKPKLVEIFLHHNADVNLRDKNGKTALHFAASKCDDSTELLLENNANVNSQDNDGSTALHIAIDTKNNRYLLKLLLKFGADINIKNRNNDTPIDILNRSHDRSMCELYYHALALEAINLYYAKDLLSSLSEKYPTEYMELYFEDCKEEIEKLKFVRVPGYRLTCYALMTRSIHSVASYVKNEDLITHFQSVDFTTEFPIYAPIIQGRLRNAFQRSPFIGEAGDFFNYNFKLPHVCVDHILSCLSLDDLKNVKDAI